MPKCEGLPDGPCPDGRIDGTVKLGKGDLMLCVSCDTERRRLFDAMQGDNKGNNNAKSGQKLPIVAGQSDDTQTYTIVSRSGRNKVTRSSADAIGKSGKSSVGRSVSDEVFADGKVDAGKSADLVVNELLMYVTFHRGRSNTAALKSVLISFYSSSEISLAKKQLIAAFSSYMSDCASTERRNSVQRPASEAEVDDILELMDNLDNQNILSSVQFAAVQYDRIPGYGPEEVNILTVVERQAATDQSIAALSSKVDRLSVIDDASSCKADNTQILAAIDVMNNQLRDLTQHVRSSADVNTGKKTNTVSTEDRQRNVVITGIPESTDRNQWKDKVLEVLRCAAGYDVVILDAFRLGKFGSSRRRPVLVRMSSVWDKRIVVNGARKLNDIPEFCRSVFIRPDEPVETRRRKLFDKIKARAIANGKQVSVNDDILSVDGVAVFSLVSGSLRAGDTSGVIGSSQSAGNDG